MRKLLVNIVLILALNFLALATNVDAAPRKKVAISSGVAQGLLIKRVQPVYPQEAKDAKVSGTVVLHVTIDTSGKVEDANVISGPSMLQQASLDAVQQWEYRPYLLNGEAVEVDTTVSVIFSLSE